MIIFSIKFIQTPLLSTKMAYICIGNSWICSVILSFLYLFSLDFYLPQLNIDAECNIQSN
jgi:hypothetical protein